MNKYEVRWKAGTYREGQTISSHDSLKEAQQNFSELAHSHKYHREITIWDTETDQEWVALWKQ